MNLLFNLIARIASGERLERGSRQNTAWWLGGLAVMPVVMILFTMFGTWVERTFDFSFLDSYGGVFVMIILLCLVMFALLIPCVRIFQGSPLWLIPVAAATWTGGAWIAYHKNAEKGGAPNPSLLPSLNSTSSVRGSED